MAGSWLSPLPASPAQLIPDNFFFLACSGNYLSSGARHDAHAFGAHGLERFLDSSTLVDKGYVGLGLVTPTKRKLGQQLTVGVKKNNRVIKRLRSVVERVIAQIKIWRVLHTGFRWPLGVYGRVFSSGAGVGVFDCWGEF